MPPSAPPDRPSGGGGARAAHARSEYALGPCWIVLEPIGSTLNWLGSGSSPPTSASKIAASCDGRKRLPMRRRLAARAGCPLVCIEG